MNPRRISAVILRQLYLIRGSATRVVPMFAWVGIDIVLWGFISKYLTSFASPGFNFMTVLLGAILLWELLVRVMHSLDMAFFEDIWAKNFLNIFASPLTTAEYLTGLVIFSIFSSIISLVFMLGIATLFFGLDFAATTAPQLFMFMLILFLSGIALGILGVAIVLRYGPASEWFIWPVPMLISPFAGVFYPIDTLPQWMQWVSWILPPSYVFEGLRAVVAGKEISSLMLWGGCAMALCYIGLACWYFNRIFKKAVRTGLIARYSAETVT
jgi:ABC-2 type transport system permease protein